MRVIPSRNLGLVVCVRGLPGLSNGLLTAWHGIHTEFLMPIQTKEIPSGRARCQPVSGPLSRPGLLVEDDAGHPPA